MLVVFILGPTASGKSKLSLSLAEEFSGEIVNLDSVQFYKGLDIGSAKPTKSEFERVPHHLFDICEKGQNFSAGDFERVALSKLHELDEKGVKLCVCVGGSGFYLKALRYGMFESPKLDEKKKVAFEEHTSKLSDEDLYEKLKECDDVRANALEPADRYRILRALVIIEATGRKASDVEKDFVPRPFPYPHLVVGLQRDREKLKADIKNRAASMLHNGLIGEVQGLLKEGLEDWKALGSVGYKEVCAHLRGEISQEELPEEISKSTRQLAKRQMTWFRKEEGIQWINVDEGFDRAFSNLKTLVQNSMREVSSR